MVHLQLPYLRFKVVYKPLIIDISTIYANKTTTIAVKVLDSSGNPVFINTTQLLFVQITNECTKGSNFDLVSVNGRQTTLDQDIFEQLILTSNGTYQHSFTIAKEGKISISVLLYTQGGVFAEYFDNMLLNGTNSFNRTETLSNFAYNWGSSSLYPNGKTDYVSARFNFLLKWPTSETVSFQLNVDDYGYMNVGKYLI